MRFLGSFFLFICISVIFCCGFGCVEDGGLCHAVESAPVTKTILVDKHGHGDFTTIQSAINSIPSGNRQWMRIFVSPGIYWEKVMITPDKPFILLEGNSKHRTTIAWNDASNTVDSATFSAFADNFVAKWIHFQNTYNYGNNKNALRPAVAAFISGDKSSFYQCGFYGVQDTLLDSAGRHYFKNCSIEGAVDFIFGAGKSIYETCNITVQTGEMGVGYVTAQGRSYTTQASGFVFKSCYLEGNGKAFLGRAWRAYSRVLFYKSYLSNVVVPQGWDAWYYQRNLTPISFAEHGCWGAGSDMAKRVAWEKKLSRRELSRLTSLSYINRERWLQQQP